MICLNLGGHWDPPRKDTKEEWAPAYTWMLTGKTHLRSALQNLRNHLILKKEQAAFALWWIDNIGGKHVAEEVRRFGTAELKAMKKDPQRLNERAVLEITELMRKSDQALA
jgi:hypothetical protein